ncbi:acetyltransferase [Chromatiales bacterium (ex Bugula neritina AB1)]|nr:acetyltransferase [Chromatiales bacterium (ex Bugula neritina AB1)]
MISTLVILPLYLVYSLFGLFCDRNGLFSGFSQFLSLLPGKCGSYLRNSFYQRTMTRCDPGVVFSFGALFSQVDTEVSSGTYIGPQCNIGSCNIGRDCLVGSGVHILSGKQQHAINDLDTPIRDQGGVFTKVSVGDDCWIGNGAIIMADVGSKCVVAAGAVVVNPVSDRMIVAGNPAVVVKER